MSRFPGPIPLPQSVKDARSARKAAIVSSAKWGMWVRLAVTALELLGFVLYDSDALFVDAIASLFDIASTIVLIFFISLASKPPDEDHPFGHGRFEPLVGLQISLLLIGIGLGLFIKLIVELPHEGGKEDLSAIAWLIPLTAVFLLEGVYRLMSRIAKAKKSPALLAEARHYRIDSLTSLVATIALALAAFFPSVSFLMDAIGALVIACFMIGIGLKSLKENAAQVLDRQPDGERFDAVREAALRVSGVHGTEKIQIQQFGPDAHVCIDIEVDPLLSVEKAHRISQHVRREIQKEWPAVRDATVHIEPYYPGDH